MEREPCDSWDVLAPRPSVAGWIDDLTRDARLLQLCIAAIGGDEAARGELAYLFPWKGDAPRERLREVKAPEVRRLVHLVVAGNKGSGTISELQHTVRLRSALNAATSAISDQADVLGMLVEAR